MRRTLPRRSRKREPLLEELIFLTSIAKCGVKVATYLRNSETVVENDLIQKPNKGERMCLADNYSASLGRAGCGIVEVENLDNPRQGCLRLSQHNTEKQKSHR